MKNLPIHEAARQMQVGVDHPDLFPYIHKHTSTRRLKQATKVGRFRGNNKGISLSVTPSAKFARVVQEIPLPNGKVKRILHYVLRKGV